MAKTVKTPAPVDEPVQEPHVPAEGQALEPEAVAGTDPVADAAVADDGMDKLLASARLLALIARDVAEDASGGRDDAPGRVLEDLFTTDPDAPAEAGVMALRRAGFVFPVAAYGDARGIELSLDLFRIALRAVQGWRADAAAAAKAAAAAPVAAPAPPEHQQTFRKSTGFAGASAFGKTLPERAPAPSRPPDAGPAQEG